MPVVAAAAAMSRRRLSLGAYVRRRWRAVGAIVVLFLGALLVVAVTDRGHDPIWLAGAGALDQTALSPDGAVAYVLLRDTGNVSGIAAYRATDGARLWEGELNATRALLAAGPHGVAVATDFPRAFLTFYGVDGSIDTELSPEGNPIAIEGNPVAMAIDGERLALALNAPGNPVLLFEKGRHVATFEHASAVRALDAESELVAVAGLSGEVVVRNAVGRELLNATLPMSVRSLRLSADGTTVVVGGFGLTPAAAGGHVALLDVGSPQPVRWVRDTPEGGVGLVDVDALGLYALAVEETPPTSTLHLYEGATGATQWWHILDGSVARHDSGASGGAALSPDGRAVAVGTLRGDVAVYKVKNGDESWTYRAGGVNAVAFAKDQPSHLLAGARLLQSRPHDSLLFFLLHDEPAAQRATLLAGGLATLAGSALALFVGIGFYRARRTY